MTVDNTQKPTTHQFRYRPDIDGLRALAVVMVLIFHSGLGLTGGYVGVDVFFVISGFLITGLIQKELASGEFNLKKFWVGRVRRILPAAYVCTLGTLFIGSILLMPPALVDLATSALFQQLMVANFYFWKTGDYFGGASEWKPLLHMWSLAVEEQFYVFYPFFLLLLRNRSKQFLLIALVAIAIASLIVSEMGVHHFPTATFFLLPTRMWELLVGAIIVFLPTPKSVFSNQKILAILSMGGLSAVIYSAVFFDSLTPFPGKSALIPCLGAALLIYAQSGETPTLVGRLLSLRPLVFIGLISYSLYLWHWPVFAFSRYWLGSLSVSLKIASLLVSFALAYLSYYFVETPMRRGRDQVKPAKVFSTALISASILVLISIFGKKLRRTSRTIPYVDITNRLRKNRGWFWRTYHYID